MPNRDRIVDELIENPPLLLSKLVDQHGRPFEPTDAQVPLLNCRTRNQVWLMGRRSGKTTTAAVRTILEMMKPGRRIWVVAPFHDLTEKIYRQVHYYATTSLPFMLDGVPKNSKNGMSMKFITGSELVCKTANKPDQLVGESLDLVLCDESGSIGNYPIELILPALTDINPLTGKAKGKLVAVGTPRLHNWFKEHYDLGTITSEEQLKIYKGEILYAAYRASSFSNPHIDHDAIRAEIMRKPVALARQEYYAEWQSEGGEVFTGAGPGMYLPVDFRSLRQGAVTYVGVDIARTMDFTVISALNPRLEMVGFDRLNTVEWEEIVSKIKRRLEEYSFNGPVVCCIDESGVGAPIFRAIDLYFKNNNSVTIIPINFQRNITIKNNIVEDMKLTMSEGLLKLYDLPEIRGEINDYAFKQSARGPVYGAPEGKHDDIVTGVGLSIHATCYTVNGDFIALRAA